MNSLSACESLSIPKPISTIPIYLNVPAHLQTYVQQIDDQSGATYSRQNFIFSGSENSSIHTLIWSPIFSKMLLINATCSFSSRLSSGSLSCFRTFFKGRIFSLHCQIMKTRGHSVLCRKNYIRKQSKCLL